MPIIKSYKLAAFPSTFFVASPWKWWTMPYQDLPTSKTNQQAHKQNKRNDESETIRTHGNNDTRTLIINPFPGYTEKLFLFCKKLLFPFFVQRFASGLQRQCEGKHTWCASLPARNSYHVASMPASFHKSFKMKLRNQQFWGRRRNLANTLNCKDHPATPIDLYEPSSAIIEPMQTIASDPVVANSPWHNATTSLSKGMASWCTSLKGTPKRQPSGHPESSERTKRINAFIQGRLSIWIQLRSWEIVQKHHLGLGVISAKVVAIPNQVIRLSFL